MVQFHCFGHVALFEDVIGTFLNILVAQWFFGELLDQIIDLLQRLLTGS